MKTQTGLAQLLEVLKNDEEYRLTRSQIENKVCELLTAEKSAMEKAQGQQDGGLRKALGILLLEGSNEPMSLHFWAGWLEKIIDKHKESNQ